MKHLTSILAILVMIFVGLACSGSDETLKANAIVADANKFVTTANESVVKAGAKFDVYETKVSEIRTVKDLGAAQEFANELLPLYDSMNENFRKAGEKFEEASKLRINEKHKEYLETKAKEMKLRGDYALELKKIPLSLIISTNKQGYEQSVRDLAQKINKMTSEAKELGEKAAKIQKDNPDILAPPKKA